MYRVFGCLGLEAHVFGCSPDMAQDMDMSADPKPLIDQNTLLDQPGILCQRHYVVTCAFTHACMQMWRRMRWS
jgi:hypothetical protein